MNKSDIRTIHTGLYSKIAKEILDSVCGQLSDGMWENSPTMDKYWKFVDIEQNADNEIVLNVSNEYGKSDGSYHRHHYTSNGFKNMSDDEIIKWFAKKIKHIAVTEMKDDGEKSGWKRDNDKFESQYLSYHETITVSDIYYVYDFLLNRKPENKKLYDGHVDVNKVIGRKLDSKSASDKQKLLDTRAEAETAFAKACEEIDKLRKAELEAVEKKYHELRSQKWNEYHAIYTEIDKKLEETVA